MIYRIREGTVKRKVIITAVCVLIAAAACIYIVFALNGRSEKHTAQISSDGKVVRTVDLDTAPDETFTVECGNGYNIITVENGEIFVSGASCPDKICEHQGALKNELLPIVCVPNKLVITLV